MKLGRIVTGLSGVALCIFGGAYFVAPEMMASKAAIVLMLPSAVADIRATYGGFQLGMGLFFLMCAIRNIWIAPALAAQIFAFGGFAFGRTLGVIADRAIDPMTVSLFALELAGFALASFAFQRTK